MLFVTTKPERVDVPEEDIVDCVNKINTWFESNPERTDCRVGLFGHKAYLINRDSVEKDVREYAKTATKYEML